MRSTEDFYDTWAERLLCTRGQAKLVFWYYMYLGPMHSGDPRLPDSIRESFSRLLNYGRLTSH